MKKHSGMRPHDIVVLLKIAAKDADTWYMKDLANELGISASEISESINRSVIAGLLFADKKKLMKTALLDFLKSGLPYVYPQQPGALVRGVPTAHSAKPLSSLIQSEEPYVWPYSKGTVRGQSVEPLHFNVPKACLKDEVFYEYMALSDVMRLGRVREKNIALKELEKRLC
ncbi:helix-turn-helix domain-containing protein [Salegentibacter sp. F188]|uniref:Helix-turn-helix domain-containing protein n=1 Tax=Autumnicola patrickiae TaxID=3075591 RepID=A0ABU3E352_9FLAO|nr:helix-turn-helix domain-containing protein [Salegentibacter sp. F188]MDT0690328.1 helix-turn-helix domain-containing protein [Salegentibacter sp. F188]